MVRSVLDWVPSRVWESRLHRRSSQNERRTVPIRLFSTSPSVSTCRMSTRKLSSHWRWVVASTVSASRVRAISPPTTREKPSSICLCAMDSCIRRRRHRPRTHSSAVSMISRLPHQRCQRTISVGVTSNAWTRSANSLVSTSLPIRSMSIKSSSTTSVMRSVPIWQTEGLPFRTGRMSLWAALSQAYRDVSVRTISLGASSISKISRALVSWCSLVKTGWTWTVSSLRVLQCISLAKWHPDSIITTRRSWK